MQYSTTRPRELAGTIRELRTTDLPQFRAHLLRLDAPSRRDRFNGLTDDEFVATYAARCFTDGTTVIAYLEDGLVRGAAELHEQSPGDSNCAEIAFSVEQGWQNGGLGSRLFERLIVHARKLGCRRLQVTTHPQNEAMKALARKFRAKLSFEQGETVGIIELVGTKAPASKTRRTAARIRADLERTASIIAPAEERTPADALIGLVRAVVRFQRAAAGLGRDRDRGH